jgi:hypothetical protein
MRDSKQAKSRWECGRLPHREGIRGRFPGQIQEYIDTISLNDNNSHFDPSQNAFCCFRSVLKGEIRILLNCFFEKEQKLGI